MAYNSHSSLFLLFQIFNILLVTVASRYVPNASKNVDKKQPEWFIEPDGSLLIPGIGRVMVPSLGGCSSYTPYIGDSGDGNLGGEGGDSTGSGGASGSFPDGDNTFALPIDIPNPAGGSGILAPAVP